MRVAGQRDRHAGVDGHLEHRPRRVDLADRLAQAGGGDLHRHAGVEHRLDRRLVVEARVGVRHGPCRAPDLHEIWVGDDVEDAGQRGLRERLEVALPHALGRRLPAPDVGLVVEVDGVVADEVHRADHVVPLVRVEQVRHPVLAAGDVVGLDPEPQVGVLAHEGDVGVQVVDGVRAPERVLPDVERGGEAVDVLGHAELGHAALGRRPRGSARR